jgi:ring-1,2-phenylacetyl-CoA epoxidase subunit PaaD
VVSGSPSCSPAVSRQGRPGDDPSEEAQIWRLLEQISDPEIPVLSLIDLGVVRQVRRGDRSWEVVITPTYSGCPALSQMADDIVSAMAAAGLQVQVCTQLAPAWSTDWISASGRRKLREYGIAPPAARGVEAGNPAARVLRFLPRALESVAVACPRCSSTETVETSHFGSTACKAMYRCLACREPFDYFKPY